MMDNSRLAPVLEVPTSLPFPDPLNPTVADDCIGLRISSEFTTYIAPVTLVDGQHKLGLVRDACDQPLLFSVGNLGKLMCFHHENGASDAWQSYDISPAIHTGQVFAFDVTETYEHLTLAVALRSNSNEPSQLFTFVCKKKDFDPMNVSWVSRPADHGGPSVITSLLCGGADPSGRAIVTTGIEATKDLTATYYQVDTNPAVQYAWVASPLPENAQRIVRVAPGQLPGALQQGYYCLYQFNNGALGCAFQKSDHSLKKHFDISKAGAIRDIHAAVTPYGGCTDLFMATEHGILFFSQLRLDETPEPMLPNIGFRQVVAAEHGTKILLFAVSDANELYYLEGTREASVNFQYSGLPIRSNVAILSVAYNANASAVELMYVDSTQHGIRHLWRDPVSFIWQEAALTVRSPKNSEGRLKTRSFPAYITCISIVNDETGQSIGANYRLGLSSDLVYVTVNDHAYMLGKSPVSVVTDANGCITVIQQVTDALSSPVYTVHLTPSDASQPTTTIVVNPAQRVVQQLCKYTTADSIANARTTDGRKVPFSSSTSAESFGAAAKLLGQVGSMVHTIDPAAGKQLLPGSHPLDENAALAAYEVVQDGSVREAVGWFEDVAHSVAQFFGDVWETVKRGLKAVFRFAVRVVGKVILMVISIGGKIFKFVVEAVGPLLRGIAGFLGEALGLDLLGFLDWLGFGFDWNNIVKTQQHLIAVGEGLLQSMEDFFEINRPVVKEAIEATRGIISNFIKDNRIPVDPPGKPRKQHPLVRALGWLFNNPIVKFLMKYNPILWIMREVDDIIGEDVQLPDISPLEDIFKDTMPDLFGEQLDIFSRLGSSLLELLPRIFKREVDLGTALQEVLGDFFWTMFDSTESAILAAFDTLGKFAAVLHNIFTQEIKIPIITDVWTALTGQPLTIMNLITLIPAFVLNEFTCAVYKGLPFDDAVFGDPRRFLPKKSDLKLPSISLLAGNFMSGIAVDPQELSKHIAEFDEQVGADRLQDTVSLHANQVTHPVVPLSLFSLSHAEIGDETPPAHYVSNFALSNSSTAKNKAPDSDAVTHSRTFEQSSSVMSTSYIAQASMFKPVASPVMLLADPSPSAPVSHPADSKTQASPTSQSKNHEHLTHKLEVGSGLISAILGLFETGIEMIEAKAPHEAARPRGKGLSFVKIVLGGLGCLNKLGSMIIALYGWDHGIASSAIGLLKFFDFVLHCVAVGYDCMSRPPIYISVLRTYGCLYGGAVSGIFEAYVSDLDGAPRLCRLIADLCEFFAAYAGSCAVGAAMTGDPNSQGIFLGFQGALDAMNLALSITAIKSLD